jgi:hypothetical protein
MMYNEERKGKGTEWEYSVLSPTFAEASRSTIVGNADLNYSQPVLGTYMYMSRVMNYL